MVLRYIAATVKLGINYPRSAETLSPQSAAVNVDADWGGHHNTGKSTAGYGISVNKTTIIWRTRKQTVIALSSAELEYIALSECVKHVP